MNYGNRPGNALNGNGLFPTGFADDDQTMFYVFLETELKF